MEAGRARNRDDNPGLPTLSLGLSSVRHIVTKLEADYARVVTTNAFKSEIVKYKPCSEDNNDYYHYPFDSKAQVLNRFVANLGVAFGKCVPSVTLANFGFLAVTSGLFAPRMISYLVVYPFCRLVFGTLYPAYASYKAVRTKNLKEYVKWMMYWIVFALFTCTETFTDVFLSWFPFYYEVKIVLVLWLLSPATKGSSILYRKFVHPALCRREQEIDEYIAKAKDQGYHTVLNLGTKGVNYATTVIMQTAIKGGGGLVQQIRKSYSLSDLTECEPREERGADEADDVLAEPRLIRRAIKSGYATRRSASESNRSSLYFPEVDVDVRPRPSRMDEPDFSHIKSTEDISSGYSSAENSASLTRTASVGGSRPRVRSSRTTVTTIKRPQAAEDNHVIIEELHDDDSHDYNNMPPLVNYTSPLFLSHTDPPFIYQYVGNEVKVIQVLGSYPLSNNNNSHTDNSDKRDQKEASVENLPSPLNKRSDKENVVLTSKEEKNVNKDSDTDIPIEITNKSKHNNRDESNFEFVESLNLECNLENKLVTDPICEVIDKGSETLLTDQNVSEDLNDSMKRDLSTNKYDSGDSDDEASFETPVSTPKISRKNMRGKYGKDKAPVPPITKYIPEDQVSISVLNENVQDSVSEKNLNNETNVSHEKENNSSETENAKIFVSSTDKDDDIIIDNISSKHTETCTINEVEQQITEKSKSPVRNSKTFALGKILQLPSKLVFWHKTDDKLPDSNSEGSRRSSTNTSDEFQSCSNLNKNDIPHIIINESLPKDEIGEDVAQNILEKSDALQKAIEAKLENHPEYKFVSLHEDIPTTSKSTDV